MSLPYSALAPIYDRMMAHVSYDRWVELINSVIAGFCKVPDPALLELGAGTGVLGKQLLDAGYRYTGSDISPSMCFHATRHGQPFFACDALDLPVRRNFDIVLFLYDGINYLQDLSQYDRLFNQVHGILNDCGLFLFDVTTQANSQKNFEDFLDHEEFEDYTYIRHSFFHRASLMQYNDFIIFKRIGDRGSFYEKLRERHCQKVFPPAVIRKAIPSNLFEVLGVWDGFSQAKITASSERVHFLLRKRTGP